MNRTTLTAAKLFALVNAGKIVHAGHTSTLRKVGDRFVMTADWNPGHSLAVDVTNAERLHAHWEGFKHNTNAKLSDDIVA
jgi:hypothetical protein